jgi:hypothetical protein
MKFVVRPELPTASVGSSQAPTAAVVNSAPVSTHPEPTYKSGKAVQTTGTTSNLIERFTNRIAEVIRGGSLSLNGNEVRLALPQAFYAIYEVRQAFFALTDP